jgi:hypothetical protein
MEIDKSHVHIQVQNLCIVTEQEQLTKINMGFKENLQQVKINFNLKPIINSQLIELLKEFKHIFAWMYKDLKGIPLEIAQHQIEFDTSIPPIHQAKY